MVKSSAKQLGTHASASLAETLKPKSHTTRKKRQHPRAAEACSECFERRTRCSKDSNDPNGCDLCVKYGRQCIARPGRRPRGAPPPDRRLISLGKRVDDLESCVAAIRLQLANLNAQVNPPPQLPQPFEPNLVHSGWPTASSQGGSWNSGTSHPKPFDSRGLQPRDHLQAPYRDAPTADLMPPTHQTSSSHSLQTQHWLNNNQDMSFVGQNFPPRQALSTPNSVPESYISDLDLTGILPAGSQNPADGFWSHSDELSWADPTDDSLATLATLGLGSSDAMHDFETQHEEGQW